MKSLSAYIQEKLIIKKSKYNYFPETREELQDIIKKRIKQEGNEVDLNDIDVSKWDVSNVTDMSWMFCQCENFNQDISNWDVSNVKNTSSMFYKCKSFNQDISNLDFSNVNDMSYMFYYCSIEEKYKPKFK